MKLKPIVFARIASMKYYKGITDKDTPENGGSYVTKNGDAHECYNFDAVNFDDGKSECFGFAMITGGGNCEVQLKIENIVGCANFKDEEYVEGVTVVWCAKANCTNSLRVVGFYKNATVFRHRQLLEFDNGDKQGFNFVADKEDCVLIPYQKRFSDGRWYIPTSGKNKYDFGFGRSSVWYGGSRTKNKKEIEFVEKMIENIENYDGENWIEEGRFNNEL